ncbi:AI-2E family transporter [Endothiovibrio diazotrophicus]
MQPIRDWFQRYFSDPQVVILALLLAFGFAVVLLAGDMLLPVLAGVVVAYLLEGIAGFLEKRGVPRLAAVLVVFSLFMAFLLFVIFGLLPMLSQQVSQLIQELPKMIARGQEVLLSLPERYPQVISEEQVRQVIQAVRGELTAWGQRVVSMSLASVVGLITLMVYLVLLPLLVFFFLKDKRRIIGWFVSYLPHNRELATAVWREVDGQIGNYVRGKFWEIVIVWWASYITFSVMGLNYAMLLGLGVGLSVIIPYIGAVVVTIPVALIAYFQWGFTPEFGWLLLAYGIIQAIDGNVLVPLIFSEAVNLHPVAIIVAVLMFGGLWGFWGVFFAIPLATLVQAVLTAWPRRRRPERKPELPGGEGGSVTAG